MNGRPEIMALERKLRVPVRAWINLTLTFFDSTANLSMSKALLHLSSGIDKDNESPFSIKPKKTKCCVTHSVLLGANGHPRLVHKDRNLLTRLSHSCLPSSTNKKSSR